MNGARDVDEWFEEEQKVVEKRHEESQAAEALFRSECLNDTTRHTVARHPCNLPSFT